MTQLGIFEKKYPQNTLIKILLFLLYTYIMLIIKGKTMDREKLEVGNVVLLNTGVYLMTIKEINENIATCTWLNYRDELLEEEFDIRLLINVEKIFNDSNSPDFNIPPHLTTYDDYEYIRAFGYYSFYFKNLNKIKSTNDLSIGDIVKLNSHFTYMCIEEIKEDTSVCVWFNKYGYLKREVFKIETLTKCKFVETAYADSGF